MFLTKKEEKSEVFYPQNKRYAIHDVAELTGKGISTIQRIKNEFVAWHIFVKPGGVWSDVITQSPRVILHKKSTITK